MSRPCRKPVPTVKSKLFRENLTVIGLIAVLLAVFFYDVVFFGKTFKVTSANPQALMTGPYGQENNKPSFFSIFTTDVSLNEEPTLVFIKRSFWQGTFPMWNPHLACGYPLIALIQIGLFFPLNLLFYVLPDLIAWDALIFGRFFLAGFFIYWFVRVLRLGRIPALGAVVIYMLAGPVVKLQAWMANVDVIGPLLFLCFELLLRRRGLFRMAVTAGAIALTVFAGHPEHLVVVHTLAVLFFVFRLFTARPRPPVIKTFYFLAGAYALGFALGAIVLLPFLRNWLTVFWHSHPEDMGVKAEYAKEPRFYFSVLFPIFFQKFPISMNWIQAGWWGSIGLLPFGLTFLSLWHRQRWGLNWFIAAGAFVLLGKIFINAPPFTWIGLLPVYRYLRFANHSAHQVAFLLAVGSAMGLRVILLKRQLFKKALLFAVPVLAALAAALYLKRNAVYIATARESAIISTAVIGAFLLFLFLKDKRILTGKAAGLAVLAVLTAEMFAYIPRGRVNRFESFPQVPYVEFLKKSHPRSRVYGIFWTLYPNTATAYQLDDLGVFHGLLCQRYVDFVNEFLVKDYFVKDHWHTSFWVVPVTFMPEARPFMDLLNVRYTAAPIILKDFFVPARLPDFPKPMYKREAAIYPHPSAFPRVFIVHRAIFEPDKEKVFAHMRELKGKLRGIAVLSHPPEPEILEQLASTPIMDNSWAGIKDYGPNEVLVEARLQHPGLLVMSDTYHPDWKAFVNGKPARIYVTDHLIRSVFLPKGESTVRFVYRPIGFYIGRWISAVALVVLVLLLWKTRRRNNTSC